MTNNIAERFEMRDFTTRRFAQLLLVSLCCAQALASDQVRVITGLESGWNEWLRSVEFKCSYVYTESIADSQREAEESRSLMLLKTHGELNKTGENTLLSCLVDLDEYRTPQLHDFAAVSSAELDARYIPHLSRTVTNGALRQFFVVAKTPDDVDLPYPRVDQRPPLGPLIYAGGAFIPNFITGYLRLKEKGVGTVLFRVESTKKDKIVVHVVFKTKTEETVATAVYNLVQSCPLVEEIDAHTEFTDTDVAAFELHVRASRFVEVGSGLFVPSKIQSVSGPLREYRGRELEGKWLSRVWLSADMGQELPTGKDLVIRLESGTSVAGLGMEAKRDLKSRLVAGPVSFDIRDYSVADLESSGRNGRSGNDGHFGAKRIGFAAVGLVCAFVVIFLAVRKKRMRGRDEQ